MDLIKYNSEIYDDFICDTLCSGELDYLCNEPLGQYDVEGIIAIYIKMLLPDGCWNRELMEKAIKQHYEERGITEDSTNLSDRDRDYINREDFNPYE